MTTLTMDTRKQIHPTFYVDTNTACCTTGTEFDTDTVGTHSHGDVVAAKKAPTEALAVFVANAGAEIPRQVGMGLASGWSATCNGHGNGRLDATPLQLPTAVTPSAKCDTSSPDFAAEAARSGSEGHSTLFSNKLTGHPKHLVMEAAHLQAPNMGSGEVDGADRMLCDPSPATADNGAYLGAAIVPDTLGDRESDTPCNSIAITRPTAQRAQCKPLLPNMHLQSAAVQDFMQQLATSLPDNAASTDVSNSRAPQTPGAPSETTIDAAVSGGTSFVPLCSEVV